MTIIYFTLKNNYLISLLMDALPDIMENEIRYEFIELNRVAW